MISLRLLVFVGLIPLSAGSPLAGIVTPPAVIATNRPFVRESVLAERDFPFLSELLGDPATLSLLAHDERLQRITQQRWESAAAANGDCHNDRLCKSSRLQFTAAQTAQIASSLRRIYKQSDVLRNFVQTRLVPVSTFGRNKAIGGEDLLVQQWKDSAAALDRIITTYCDGASPRYPDIDSTTYAPDSKPFGILLQAVLNGLPIEEEAPLHSGHSDTLFFEPALRFSLRLLQANSRDEAGRFWPLDTNENAAPVQRTATIDWSRYPYSVIVIPGAGPEEPAVALSPVGKERVRLGVEAYRSGKAPYIMVSGGFVHPSQTPFCEAIEMKKYLLEIYGIPEAAILLEPYARHTTTNIRNAAREVFWYRLPANRPMLLVSDSVQTEYMQGRVFADRNREELGYLPAVLGKRLSPTQLEATPSIESLFRDATDPLDP